MKCCRLFLAASLTAVRLFSAEPVADGTVSGTVTDQTTQRPVGFATVVLKKSADQSVVRTGVTDAKGAFVLDHVPDGEYQVYYNTLGADPQGALAVSVDAAHRTRDLGQLVLTEVAVKLEKMEVSSRKEAFANSIDRKVYNVGKDIQSATGSASDLLQNVPSVQVDIDGNVSLRGDGNVLILIDGKTSALMGANRAAVLEQMPADAIEKIEVITNPSAKYKPDGTAGIINIALKRKRDPGYSGTARVSVGNDRRGNASVAANYNPGRYNLFGSYSVRQDDRLRVSHDQRSHLDPATNTVVATEQVTQEHSRPLSHVAQVGTEYSPDEQNKLSAVVKFNRRTFFRSATDTHVSRDGRGAVAQDYDRDRVDPEVQRDLEFNASLQHTFPQEGHELNFEVKRDLSYEIEDNHYTNIYRTPAATPTTYDNTLIKQDSRGLEALVEYVRPLENDGKLEAGYTREANRNDMDFYGEFYDPGTRSWVKDTTVSNRFLYDDAIDALYATYGRPVGDFGFLAGVRLEQAAINLNQVTTGLRNDSDYFRLYPSLHLSYNLSQTGQLQLNYSHRVHRPESDDLNPFPEYQDPFNLRAGNPHLKPEDIHSVESGYQYKNNDTTYLATVYYRYRYNGMTSVTRYINATTLLTTKENLATSRSTGLELAATTNVGGALSLNFSGNAYRNEIDASNLGYSTRKSALAWDAKLNANYHATKSTLIQLNTNYTAKRLTPQGERSPTYVVNLGVRHDLADKKTALILTVSDVFDSLKERTLIDTPALHQDVTRRRSPRIIYLGFSYNFGKAKKKGKDDLQFDNSL